MEIISDFIKSDTFIIAVAVLNLILIVLYICNVIKLKKLNKNYKKFMNKLGNGNNIDEMLKEYIEKVEEVDKKNEDIMQFCSRLDKEISLSIKKIGMIRYSAFKDTGSDLSFALALLNGNNDGVLLNGIYSREMSNIYAKQVSGGKTNCKLSDNKNKIFLTGARGYDNCISTDSTVEAGAPQIWKEMGKCSS